MSGLTYLFISVVLEVAGTTSMKLSQGFTRFWPAAFIFIFYGFAFTGLTMALQSLNLGTAYAIWSGLGTGLTALIGYFIFKESLNTLKILGITTIVAGIFLMKFF
jgi:small multidrug resistance pump